MDKNVWKDAWELAIGDKVRVSSSGYAGDDETVTIASAGQFRSSVAVFKATREDGSAATAWVWFRGPGSVLQVCK